ncbi:MAG: hypothetical protein M3021_11720, partial [Actinomycetota bacterium]|nr:hypothetical protein [Actinomycetota bacterium]
MNRTSLLRSTVLASAMAVILLLGGLVPSAVHTAFAAAGLSLSRSTVAPGDKVVASGAGYTPGDNVVVFADFTVGGAATRTQVATSTTSNGTFSATFTVPPGTAPNTYRLTARDFHNHTATQFLNVLPLAQLKVGAQPGTITVVADHYFYVRGSGFKAGETVHLTASFPLYNGNAVSVSKPVTADSNGAFGEVAIQAPRTAKADTVTLTAKGNTSGTTVTANVKVIYRPSVSLNPSALRPGGAVAANGSGFVPNTTIHVAVTIPRQNASTVTLSKDVPAGDRGAFTVSLTLPVKTSPGAYTVTADDAVGGFRASAKLTVTLQPVIAVLPNTIAPGHSVTVNGSGFTANASVALSAIVPLYGGGSHTVAQTVQTDSTGNFSTHLTIPGGAAAGTVIVLAAGPNGQSKGAVSIQHVPAHIAVSPTSVRPGSSATVKGAGYPAGDHIALSIAVKLSNGSTKVLATTATADGQGKFTAPISIPAEVVAGAYTVVAKSESTNRAPSARLQVAVSGKIELRPAAVSPGGTTTVSGHGFSSGVAVAVSANVALFGGGSKSLSTSAHTDGSGAFTTKLGIPGNAAAGTVTVIAKGPHTATSARLQIGRVLAAITLSASSIIPGTPLT